MFDCFYTLIEQLVISPYRLPTPGYPAHIRQISCPKKTFVLDVHCWFLPILPSDAETALGDECARISYLGLIKSFLED